MTDLVAGDWRLKTLPHVGGAISHLTWRGRDILRPSGPNPPTARQTGCFPLVPFTNRIAGGRFVFEGREVVLPQRDPRCTDNAIHGDGWVSEWQVKQAGANQLVLTYDHPTGQAWPWPYQARQIVTLADEEALIDLALTNTGDETMPAGLGFHPYFPCGPESQITAQADKVWLVDEAFIPTELVEPKQVIDWSTGPRLADAPPVDHAYAGWNRRAVLTHGDLITEITASSAGRWLQIFVPHGGDFCAIEPVTHVPAALNHPETFEQSGMTRLNPDQTLALRMTLRPRLKD